MFKRTLSVKLSTLVKKFPIVSIIGPRQSGKTTLAKKAFKEHDYVSLEEPNEREFALADPIGFLSRPPFVCKSLWDFFDLLKQKNINLNVELEDCLDSASIVR